MSEWANEYRSVFEATATADVDRDRKERGVRRQRRLYTNLFINYINIK